MFGRSPGVYTTVRIPTPDFKRTKVAFIFRPEFLNRSWSCFDKRGIDLYLGDTLVARNIDSDQELNFVNEMLKYGRINFGLRYIFDDGTLIVGDLVWDGNVFRIGSYIVQNPKAVLSSFDWWDKQRVERTIEDRFEGVSISKVELLIGLRYVAVWDIIHYLCSSYSGCSSSEFHTVSLSIRDDSGKLLYLSFNDRTVVREDIPEELIPRIKADIQFLKVVVPDLYPIVYRELPDSLRMWLK